VLETHKRRQIILSLLRESGMLDVDEVAARLVVSPNTIRNDFNALAAEGLLRRIRGGAALAEPTNGEQGTSNPPFQARCAINHLAKKQMARWASDLVEDGDSIVLDASSTVYHLADFLAQRRNLTVITNGIEVGRKLARNPSNTVMLLGGLLRLDGIPTADVLSDPILKDLHVKLAFVSCRAFTPATGLTEADILDAQLKARMVAAASSVIALIDASKIGKVCLAPFARLDQVAHIFTDSTLSPEWVEQLRNTGVKLTVCDENTISTFAPCDRPGRPYRIGFANLTERMPFAVQVRLGLEEAVAARKNVELLIRDNDLDRRRALENVDWFIDRQVDLVIEYQIDAEAGNIIMERFRAARIPVIAVDIPLPGAIFFGADNYRAGRLAGEGLGRWIAEHWAGALDLLLCLVDPRAGSIPAARLQGGRDGLEAVLGPIPDERVITLPCPTLMHEAQASIAAQLPNVLAHADRLASGAAAASGAHQPPTSIFHLPSSASAHVAIIAHNDDAALGALNAYADLSASGVAGHLDHVVAVGQNADRLGRAAMVGAPLAYGVPAPSDVLAAGADAAMQRPHLAFIGSTSYEPETYGVRLIDLALKILAGEPVPPAVYIDHTFVSAKEHAVP